VKNLLYFAVLALSDLIAGLAFLFGAVVVFFRSCGNPVAVATFYGVFKALYPAERERLKQDIWKIINE
jgi:hypothetical protein